MRQCIFLILFILFSLAGYCQRNDTVLVYEKISKTYFKEYFNDSVRSFFFDQYVSLADTVNFELYLPLYSFKKRPDLLSGYQRIGPYIQTEFLPYNLIVFISNTHGEYCFSVRKGKFGKLFRDYFFPRSIAGESDCLSWGISVPRFYFSRKGFPLADKKIRYGQLKEYYDVHPETTLFMIDELPGIWGYKNDRLIKLVFDRKKVEEMDGEKYYREFLFPLSPHGIKRVIEGKSFRIISDSK